jgi:hypothetical protein
VRGADAEFNVTEEMLGIQPVKKTVTGEYIFQEINTYCQNIIIVLINFMEFLQAAYMLYSWKQYWLSYKKYEAY